MVSARASGFPAPSGGWPERRVLRSPPSSRWPRLSAPTPRCGVLRGVLVKPLPYLQSDRLVAVWHTAPAMNIADLSMGPANYFIYRERSRTFQPRGSCRNFFRHGVRRASHSYACSCWPAARSMQERGSASVASTQN